MSENRTSLLLTPFEFGVSATEPGSTDQGLVGLLCAALYEQFEDVIDPEHLSAVEDGARLSLVARGLASIEDADFVTGDFLSAIKNTVSKPDWAITASAVTPDEEELFLYTVFATGTSSVFVAPAENGLVALAHCPNDTHEALLDIFTEEIQPAESEEEHAIKSLAFAGQERTELIRWQPRGQRIAYTEESNANEELEDLSVDEARAKMRANFSQCLSQAKS